MKFSSKTGLLTASNGHVWRYSDFERFLNHYITPSMYYYMCGYVSEHVRPEMFITGTYFTDGVESRAIDAYYDLPFEERKEMHEQELVNLHAEADRIRKKLDALMEAKLAFMYENPALFAVSDEIMPAIKKYEKKYTKLFDRLVSDGYIEEQWERLENM
jgi:hypothetical protein